MCQRMLMLSFTVALALGAAGLNQASGQIEGRVPLPGIVGNLDDAIKYMQSSNPKDRAFALVTFDYLGPKAQGQSQQVVGALFDPSAEVRSIAVKAIKTVDPTIAGPALALAGDNYQAKLDAIQKLQQMGTTGYAALPALAKFLESARPEDKQSIVNSIAGVGAKDPAAAKYLATVALNDPALRGDIMAKLGKMESGPGATAVFVQALQGGNAETQKLAIQGLGTVGKNNPDAIQALTLAASLAKDPKLRDEAKEALKKTK
jgi:hypothetical protein